MHTFASLIAAARGRRTQEEAAAAVGVHRNTIGRWERGEGYPSPAELGRLCDCYEMPIEARVALLSAPTEAPSAAAAS